MADDLNYFVWQVPEVGFRWLRARRFGNAGPPLRGDVGTYLLSSVKSGVLNPVQNYSPLTKFTGLFRTFSETEPTRDGIIEFANHYGFLGGKLKVGVWEPVEGKCNEATLVSGEDFKGWEAEIRSMRHTIQMWDLLQQGDTAGLSHFVFWEQYRIERGGPLLWRVHYSGEAEIRKGGRSSRGFVIASEHDYPSGLADLQLHDLIVPGWRALQKIVNAKLSEHATVTKLLRDSIRGRIELKIHLVPDSLIAALWLQFAKAVEGDKEYRQCGDCGMWFEVGGNRTARTDKQFCDGTCKSNAHRKKKDRARQLHSEGVPLSQIAQQLGTQAAKVKEWVSA